LGDAHAATVLVDFNAVSTPFQRRFNAVSTLFQRGFTAISTLFQRCFNAVLTLFTAVLGETDAACGGGEETKDDDGFDGYLYGTRYRHRR